MARTITRPNFIIIGAPKCGTTSLAELLARHPQAFMSDPKEPRFFSHDEVYNLGMDWYASLFERAEGCLAVGEASTSYATSSTDQVSAGRIHKHLPDVKLIYCVRHPLDRIESIWMERHLDRYGDDRFADVRVSRNFCRDITTQPSFVETSSYWARTCTYRKFFPDDRIHIVFLEDRQLRARETVDGVMRFLNLPPENAPPAAHRSHVSAERSVPSQLGRLLASVPGWPQVHWRLPRPIKNLVDRATTLRFDTRPKWDDRTRRDVLDRIREDVHAFLKYAGKPLDFWDLS